MKQGIVKDISFISAFIAHNFSQIIMDYSSCNYLQWLKIVTEITIEVYKRLEQSSVKLESLEGLDLITKEVKEILWYEYSINLILNDSIETGNTTDN